MIESKKEDLVKEILQFCFPISFIMVLFGSLDDIILIAICLLFVPFSYGVGVVIVDSVYKKIED
jgi:hypothetical protein